MMIMIFLDCSPYIPGRIFLLIELIQLQNLKITFLFQPREILYLTLSLQITCSEYLICYKQTSISGTMYKSPLNLIKAAS